MDQRVRRQYEVFPYPSRKPEDEDRRLIEGSPSALAEINHYVFGGRLDFRAPFKVLVAGGGTGDATVMLAQQLADAGIPAEIDYLDLSEASAAITRARLERRGLTSVRIHQGSLLALEQLPGLNPPYHYIDCCGVLHHLDQPAAGLAALTRVLAPGGGIGLMVYAPYGRTGVYPLQAALRSLGEGLAPAEQVVLARRLLERLPQGHWLRLNRHLGDHLGGGDAALYDLLLHSCDRPYTVGELAELVSGAGLALSALIEPASYHPATYVNDPRLLKHLEGQSWLAQAAWAEQVSGGMAKHIAYLVGPERAGAAVARPDDPAAIPLFNRFDRRLIERLPAGGTLDTTLAGAPVSLPLPRLARPILARIDGATTLTALHQRLTAEDGHKLAWDAFQAQFSQLYRALNGLNKLLLRFQVGDA